MSRRAFLHLLAGAAAGGLLGACAAPGAAAAPVATPTPSRGARAPIRAVCFDLFTLFDPRSVVTVANAVTPDAAALCDAWRARQFQYAFLRAAAGQYRDFARVTDDALRVAAAERGVRLSDADRARLVRAYSELAPWPDTRAVLSALRARGLKLATLANYTPAMISALLAHGGLADLFDAEISTDAAQTFKPDPRAYALGPAVLGLPREQIAFSAFGGWDAAGARWFGFPTFWVNRLGVPADALDPGPDATGPTLEGLAEFVAAWA